MEERKIVDELREIMKEKTLSLGTAARLIGCSKSSVYWWVRGKGIPSKVYAQMIRRAIRRIREINGGANG